MADSPEQAAYAWMQGAWTDFKFIATRFQQFRNRLNAADAKGASGAEPVLDEVNELERDYRALRGTGSGAPLVNNSSIQTKAAWVAMFADVADIERAVTAVERDVPGPPAGTLDKIGGLAKLALAGGALYMLHRSGFLDGRR